MPACLLKPHRRRRRLVTLGTGLLLLVAGLARGHDQSWPTLGGPSSSIRAATGLGTSSSSGAGSEAKESGARENRSDAGGRGTEGAGSVPAATPDPALEARVTAKERVSRIAGELERLRGRPFKSEVAVKVQSAEEFRRYVERALDKDLPAELAGRQSRTLQAFGLLPAGYDLRRGLADLFVSQAGAYYDPETRAFYILMAGLPDDQMDSLILHELDHALQDQYFDLQMLKERVYRNPNEDARAALGYLMEGEASYVMLKHQMKKAGQDLEALPPAGQDLVLRTMRDLDRKTLLGVSALSRPKGPEGEEIRRAIDALGEVPAVLFWSLHDPYIKGQYAIHRVFSARGWAGVDALYASPPASTEQLIHPEQLIGTRDVPVDLSLPDLLPTLGDGWAPVYSNTLGEAGILAFFDEHAKSKRVKAADGWGGDRYAVYEGKEGGLLLHWVTSWDREQDASEFQAALEAVPEGALGAGAGLRRRIVREGVRVGLVAGPAAALERLDGKLF